MKNQQGAPEALRLAEELEIPIAEFPTPTRLEQQAAAELRRLHAENERLAALVEAQQPAPSAAAATQVENLRKALQFYADKDHFNIADDGAWDTVSGEPQNYWCDEEGTATVEDGTIARLALAGHQINFDADVAPQPFPEHQADSAPGDADGEAFRTAARLGLTLRFYGGCAQSSMPGTPSAYEVVTGHDRVTAMREAVGRAEAVIAAGGKPLLAPLLAPQADSQPVPVPDVERLDPSQPLHVNLAHLAKSPKAAIEAFGAEWAGWCAASAIDALRAARAPADSVTAPAGGEIARLRAQVETLTRDCGRQASKIAELIADLKFQDGKHREDRAQLQTIYEHQRGECWYWQGDGQDHLESLCNTLPVVIRADQLRALVTTPPTQAADSVLEDAARLDWLALAGPTSICVVIDRQHDGEVEVATDDVTGYGKTLREALDAARKQGANHD